MCKAFEDLGAGGAEVAMPGRVLGEGGRGKGGRLVGKPGCAVDQLSALVGAGPGTHCLEAKEYADGRDRAHGVEGTLVIPGAAARVRDGVREREEELHVALDA